MKKQIDKKIAAVYRERLLRAEDAAAESARKYTEEYPGLMEIENRLTAENARLAIRIISDGIPRISSEERERLLKERREFLLRNGIPEDYDTIRYNCERCKDTGNDPSDDKGRCSCYLELLIPFLKRCSNFAGLSGYSFSKFDPMLFSSKKDEETYRSKNSPREQMIAIKEAAERFVSSFEQPDQPGLFFIGSPGTGKTFIAGCIANALISRGISVLYVSAPEMFEMINEYRVVSASFSPDKERLEKASDAYNDILESDLLIIDDLGTETSNANRQPELLTVINHRTGQSGKMIITTNLGMTDLMNYYDERLISRIYGGFSVYKFFGEDIRMIQRKIKAY